MVCAERFELEDMLGLHSVILPLSVEEHIYILPEGTMEAELDLNAYQAGMAEVEESKLKGNDFSDVSEVREYIPGDAMKNIHWKLSAKKDLLMVKERLRMSTGKLLMVVALDAEKPEQLDQTVERVYGLGRQLIRRQVPVTLFGGVDGTMKFVRLLRSPSMNGKKQSFSCFLTVPETDMFSSIFNGYNREAGVCL